MRAQPPPLREKVNNDHCLAIRAAVECDTITLRESPCEQQQMLELQIRSRQARRVRLECIAQPLAGVLTRQCSELELSARKNPVDRVRLMGIRIGGPVATPMRGTGDDVGV
jgi:hypothetical protein